MLKLHVRKWPHPPTIFYSVRSVLLMVMVLVGGNVSYSADAEPQPIRERGRTLLEAESLSAKSDRYPYAEVSERCSGQSTLGYYWVSSWFEMEVNVPRMSNYGISLRTASPIGTQIEVQRVDESGELKSLAKISVPNTRSWKTYTDTQIVTLSLPAGVQTLRFTNLIEGANVDYLTFSAGTNDEVVTARPAVNEGPDINPLKGFGSGWWRNDDYASVGFQYIEWGQFEPKDDEFDWDYVEEVLNREGTQGRHFILQFAVDWDWREPVDANYLGPEWLLDRVGEHRGTADPDDPDSRPMRATRYNEPVFIEEATEAIKALIDRYKEDPRTYVLQVGLLGFWGEWHTFPREDWGPTRFTKSAILEAYSKNLGADGLTQARYPDDPAVPPRPGMGYTNGSVTTTEHGYEFGEAIAENELWKNGPIGGEWPPNVDPEHWKRFFLTEEGEFFIKQARYSTILVPEAKEIKEKLPEWKQEDRFMNMHRQMGYNFQIENVRHLVSVDQSGQTHIEVDLHNCGIAPFYEDWSVQLAVIQSDTSEVIEPIEIETDLRKLAPGESVTLAGSCAEKLDPRLNYQIGLRVLQPGADETKDAPWNLNARNVYIVLANDVDVIDGEWDDKNALKGGWNLLGEAHRHHPAEAAATDGPFFPFEGSFRPASAKQPASAEPIDQAEDEIGQSEE